MTSVFYKKMRSSIYEVYGLLCDVESAIKRTAEIPDALYFKINMCFLESMMNAICHGNQLDVSKYVEIEVKVNVDEHRIILTCIDEGEGFNVAEIANTFDDESVMQDSGRGVLIIKNYADELFFYKNCNGFVCEMRFNY